MMVRGLNQGSNLLTQNNILSNKLNGEAAGVFDSRAAFIEDLT